MAAPGRDGSSIGAGAVGTDDIDPVVVSPRLKRMRTRADTALEAANLAPYAIERWFGVCVVSVRTGIRRCVRRTVPRAVWRGMGKSLPKAGRLTVAKGFYFMWNTMRATYAPFTGVFFRQHGLTAGEIGAIAALRPLVTVVGTPMWSMVADRTGMQRAILIGSLVVSTLLLVLMGTLTFDAVTPWTSVYVFYMFMTSISDFVGSPVGPLADASVLDLLGEAEAHRFGEIRSYGGYGWGLAAFATGLIVQAYGSTSIIWWLTLLTFFPTISLVLRFRVSTPHAIVEATIVRKETLRLRREQTRRMLDGASGGAAPGAAAMEEGTTTSDAAPGAVLAVETRASPDLSRELAGTAGAPNVPLASPRGIRIALDTPTTDSGDDDGSENTTPIDSPAPEPHPNHANGFVTAWRIVTISAPVTAVFLLVLAQGIGLGFAGSFGGIRYTEVGGGASLLGVSALMMSMTFALVMRVSGTLIQKYNVGAMMALGSCTCILRLVVYAFAREPWHMLVIDITHGTSWGLFWPCVVFTGRKFSPEGLTTTTLALLTMTMNGIGGSVGNAVLGSVFQSHGSQAAFLAAAGVVGGFLCIYCAVGLTRGWAVAPPPREHPLGKKLD